MRLLGTRRTLCRSRDNRSLCGDLVCCVTQVRQVTELELDLGHRASDAERVGVELGRDLHALRIGRLAICGRVIEIGATLGRSEVNPPANGTDSQDLDCEGYEFELVCNPVRNWRIAMNASRNSAITTNIVPRTARFLAERVFPLEATFGARLMPNGQSLTQEIATLRTSLLNNRDAQTGSQAAELREWTGNLVTNYTFASGFLKGVSIGGYAQYRGPSSLGATIDPATGRLDQTRIVEGNDIWLLGLNVGYERKLGNRLRWDVRLGLANLLDNTELIEKAANATTGRVVTWGVQAPRTWMLRSGLSF